MAAHSPILKEAVAPPQPELLVSAALHLMSHYSAQGAPCVKLACVIERHLRALAGHKELNPVLRATCQQLSEQWAGVVEQALHPARRSLLGRLLSH
ncbi:MAG: hypothetical protein V4723_18155 [Pseudomonadota bacterium]